MDIFDLSATLTLNSSEYESGLTDAGSKAKAFGGTFASGLKTAGIAIGALTAGVAALSVGLVHGIKNTAEYGDKVDKMSQKIGISAEAYQKWDYVMQRAGGNVDSLKMGMKTLSQQAEKGNEAFQKLGISQADVANLSQEELFEKTVKGLSEMEAGTERTALATELLGRAGADMGPLLNQGSDAIEEQMEIAEKYGMVMSDDVVKASATFEDSLTTMNMTMTGLKNRMMGEFLPAITKVTDGLAILFTGDMSGLEQIEEGINGMIEKIAEGLPKVMEIGGSIIGGIAESIVKALPSLMEQGIAIVESFAKSILSGLPNLLNIGVQMVQTITTSVVEAIPNLVASIVENTDQIVSGGVNIITALIDGVAQALPVLIEQAPILVSALAKALINNLPRILAAGIRLIGSLAKGLIHAIPQILRAAVMIISNLFSGIVKGTGKMLSAGGELIVKLAQGIINKTSHAVAKIKELVGKVKDAVVQKARDFASAGLDLVRGIWQGISDGYQWIKNRIKEWVGNVKDFIKKLFGINSPSKWARDVIGTGIVEGVALGLSDNDDMIQDAMDDLLPDEYEWDTQSMNGALTEELTVSVVGAIQTALGELTPALQEGLVDAMDGVAVKVNGRQFGKITREAINGTI